MSSSEHLKSAIDLSRQSVEQGGFPVGALVVVKNEIISVGISNGKQLNDPTSHAEIVAIRGACEQLGTRALRGAILYSSMEPCLMCYAASTWASIPEVVYAAGRGELSAQHFEGDHDLAAVNAASRKPIELTHIYGLESEALDVISKWEENR